ncbi:30S ribosomal protein S6 [Candidatus Woesebacteria bacterium RIFCSPHIGHO2_02_FULL_38_9]|uniref:Small ribosomal subunit protein bS6 n=1 Tax=Candidatus Woesebacteria bacterium RIFCSPHIGHO2_01_FULL_39_28 TaxID=1802496 RepID=A0A1F7YEH1_9BACT|nr:MAG: 30S ribosomal protein S6 [Candidatus Woesebacteria bacterium RIFCSPHIGHO2_01_FULL_39_28]OGM32266.1 MAG: 30S ribosomal protein S6 [Candidatus Woesebacteria bacterium RIFCSPHIGHO2_02_FULL_38_9]OGM56867.1 MAG: 30S ribosomal protein S6 [Candidatus Woesebacteria bacterium RIFCSPLOWO2_01_FULL_38_20]
MAKYELTLVLDGKATSAKKKSLQEFVEKLVTAAKGKISEFKDVGKKDLAYEINKPASPSLGGPDTGVFLEFTLELEPSKVKEITDKVRLKEGVIRYLMVRG